MAKTAKIPKGEAQKQKLLVTATELLAKHGLEGTSFQMIAEKCEVSQSAVLYHFPSKPDLIEACLRYILENSYEIMEGALKPTDNGLDRIKKYFRSQIQWARKHPEQPRMMMLLYFYASYDKRFQNFYSFVMKNARTRMEGYLYAAQRERMFLRNIDIPQTAELIHEEVMGGLINLLASADASTKTDAKLLKKWDRMLLDLLGLDSQAKN